MLMYTVILQIHDSKNSPPVFVKNSYYIIVNTDGP